MANLSLINAALVTTLPEAIGIRMMIEEENPILDYMTMVPVAAGSPSHRWLEETSQGTAAFRAINGTYTANHGILRPYQEPLAILGGEVGIDIAINALYGNELGGAGGIMRYQMEAKARAAYRKFEETVFEGDTGVDPNAFDGFRVRATERAMEFAGNGTGTDRAELTLAMLDEVLDAVVGAKVIHCNQFLRRKINALVRAAGQSREMVSSEFGRQFEAYANTPIVIQERRNDMTTILGFDEDPGDGGDDAASIYVAHYGGGDEDQAVMGIVGASGAWDVVPLNGDKGTQDAPLDKGRLEVYVGMAVHGNRGLARLRDIGQI
jgi:hypothetical protein